MSPLALLAFSLVVLLSLASQSGADRSWDYHGVTSKAEAYERATGNSAPTTPGPTSATPHSATPSARRDGPKVDGTKQGACSDDMFDDWAATYGHKFDARGRKKAFAQFCKTMESVRAVNSDPNLPYWTSGNAFSHLSFDEFKATYLLPDLAKTLAARAHPLRPGKPAHGKPDASSGTAARKLRGITLGASKAPPPVNWVTAGKVTPIRDQGSCNGCWAFAAVATIESMYLIKVGGNASDPLMHLSEQQLISCVNAAHGYASQGCNMGLSDEAMDYAIANLVTLDSVIPYTQQTGTCGAPLMANVTAAAVIGETMQMSGYHVNLLPYNAPMLMNAVTSAPTVAYIDVEDSFRSYAGGIYVANGCTTAVNHAIVIVGYTNSATAGNFWNVRNSWGVSWGEQGYIRIAMSSGPVGSDPGPCGMYQYGYQPPTTFASRLQLTPPTVTPASKNSTSSVGGAKNATSPSSSTNRRSWL